MFSPKPIPKLVQYFTSRIRYFSQSTSLPKKLPRYKDQTFDRLMEIQKSIRRIHKFQSLILTQPSQNLDLSRLDALSRRCGFKQFEAGEFLLKFPLIFEIYKHPVQRKLFCRLTRAAYQQIEMENKAVYDQIGDAVICLRKLLRLSNTGRIRLEHVRIARVEFGLPDDFEVSVIMKFPQYFRLCDAAETRNKYIENTEYVAVGKNEPRYSKGLKESEDNNASSLTFSVNEGLEYNDLKGLEDARDSFSNGGERRGKNNPCELKGLIGGNDSFLKVCAVEILRERGYRERRVDAEDIRFAFNLKFPPGFKLNKYHKIAIWKWQRLPYWSPYEDISGYDLRSIEANKRLEKRGVAVIHELLSLTVEKKLTLERIAHFRQSMVLPKKLKEVLLQHQGIFYISTRGNKGKLHTVFLKEAYYRGELKEPNDLYRARRSLEHMVKMSSKTRRENEVAEHGGISNFRRDGYGDLRISGRECSSGRDSAKRSNYGSFKVQDNLPINNSNQSLSPTIWGQEKVLIDRESKNKSISCFSSGSDSILAINEEQQDDSKSESDLDFGFGTDCNNSDSEGSISEEEVYGSE